MLNLQFDNLRTILCIGAHADDIEIGCGGTILKLLEQHENVNVCWVVLSGSDVRAEEARQSAEAFLADAGESRVIVKQFRDSFFPYQGEEIKEFFFELQRDVSPDVVFTHRLDDRHQDHRLIAELTWNTFRNHVVLEYEIPKYEGDLGQPNVFVPLSSPICDRKVNTTIDAFASQQDKPWFTADTLWALLRLRGVESASPAAEAFYARKLTL